MTRFRLGAAPESWSKYTTIIAQCYTKNANSLNNLEVKIKSNFVTKVGILQFLFFLRLQIIKFLFAGIHKFKINLSFIQESSILNKKGINLGKFHQGVFFAIEQRRIFLLEKTDTLICFTLQRKPVSQNLTLFFLFLSFFLSFFLFHFFYFLSFFHFYYFSLSSFLSFITFIVSKFSVCCLSVLL